MYIYIYREREICITIDTYAMSYEVTVCGYLYIMFYTTARLVLYIYIYTYIVFSISVLF